MMPHWILRIAFSWLYPWAVSAIAVRNRNDRALLAALHVYQGNNSFLDVVGAYVKLTENLDDDKMIEGIEQFIAELKMRPLKELVERYGKRILVPDFNSDPSDDITLADLLAKIIQESVEE